MKAKSVAIGISLMMGVLLAASAPGKPIEATSIEACLGKLTKHANGAVFRARSGSEFGLYWDDLGRTKVITMNDAKYEVISENSSSRLLLRNLSDGSTTEFPHHDVPDEPRNNLKLIRKALKNVEVSCKKNQDGALEISYYRDDDFPLKTIDGYDEVAGLGWLSFDWWDREHEPFFDAALEEWDAQRDRTRACIATVESCNRECDFAASIRNNYTCPAYGAMAAGMAGPLIGFLAGVGCIVASDYNKDKCGGRCGTISGCF